MRRKQAKQKRRVKMKHRKKRLSQKDENKGSMLPTRGIDSLDWMSMFFPCREAKLTGFLTCLIPCQFNYIL